MPSPALPKEVRALMEDLETLTGIAATLNAEVRGRFIVTHSNERIRLVCRYIRNSQGRLAYSSTLYQDGKTREPVADVEAYARLFKNPDLAHPNRKPSEGLPPVLPIPEGHELPPLVATVEARLTADKKPGRSISVGFQHKSKNVRIGKGMRETIIAEMGLVDTSRYVVEVRTENGNTAQIYLEPTRAGSDLLGFGGMGAVDENGCDMMAEFQGNMESAMEAILGFRMPSSTDSPAPAARRTDTRGAKTNSVEARRASVIRV